MRVIVVALSQPGGHRSARLIIASSSSAITNQSSDKHQISIYLSPSIRHQHQLSSPTPARLSALFVAVIHSSCQDQQSIGFNNNQRSGTHRQGITPSQQVKSSHLDVIVIIVLAITFNHPIVKSIIVIIILPSSTHRPSYHPSPSSFRSAVAHHRSFHCR